MSDQVSEYAQFLKAGPVPGRIDSWSEIGYYFQQIHNRMIGEIVDQIQDRLIDLGYLVGGDASLTIASGREPDIFVHRTAPQPGTMHSDTYTSLAEAIAVEVGVEADDDEYQLEALYIHERQSRKLVTVLEIISPSNKGESTARYRGYRSHLLNEGVNFVEIDPTRSVSRLFESRWTHFYSYHTAIYLPGETPRIVGSAFNEPLKPFALPLRNEVVPVNPQQAYDNAYRRMAIAGQIEDADLYILEKLPFPSTLTADQRQYALDEAQRWLKRLNELRIYPKDN